MSTAAKIKIIYWPFGGRTAVPRLALAYAGIPFDFEAVPFDKWHEMSGDLAKFPTADIPVLHYGDRVLTESAAITQFCAAISGLWPKDPLQAATCVEISTVIEEIYTGVGGVCYYDTMSHFNPGLTEEKAAELFKGPFQDHFHFYARRVNDIVNSNSNQEFAVGDALSVADLTVWYFAHFGQMDPAVFDKYDGILRIKNAVNAISGKGELFEALRAKFAEP